ncbi:MAG: histidine phosphatase family protein [Candidatus Dojkabacteria bacterium]
MTKIILARHGTYFNPLNIIPFRSNDVSLSESGIAQIERNAKLLLKENISQIYSSPITRCAETADIFSKVLKVGIEFRNELKEVYSPAYQNIEQMEYHKLLGYKSLYANSFHLKKGGEKFESIEDRMVSTTHRILKDNEGENVLVVSHGDPIMILYAYVRGIKLDLNRHIEDQLEYIRKGDMIELDFDGENLVKFKQHYFQT